MRLRRLLRLVTLGALTLAACSACSAPVTDFTFESHGTKVTLRTPRSYSPGQQASFLPPASSGNGPVRRTPRYTLSTPQTATQNAGAFVLTYSAGSAPLELRLFEHAPSHGAARETTVNLPGPPDPAAGALSRLSYLVPLKPGTKVAAFQVTSNAASASVTIHSAGLTADYPGVQFSPTAISLRTGIELTEKRVSDGSRVTTVDFAPLVADLGGAQAQIVLDYTDTSGTGVVHLTTADTTGKQQRYRLNLKQGAHSIYLYTALTGFTPDSLQVVADDPGFSINSIAVHRYPTPPAPAASMGVTTPIPADFGAMIAYAPSYWRQKEYEIFSWNLVPSVIVLQFRSYAIQARYMKRIAYFVEKYGYAGKLWTNAQLADLHGWNAHDYRPEDLARFFTMAQKEHFALNPEEEHLKKILIANHLLIVKPDGYHAGTGAILTFADVGSYLLRHILITHEGYHGIFFTHAAYRKAVFAIWRKTPPEEQRLFRDVFLYYDHYNIDNPYLVQNEFQAYLMQQPTSTVSGYFNYELTHMMKVLKIPPSSPLAIYYANHPTIFKPSAEEVQRAVNKAVGVTAGNLVGLQPD